MKLKLCNNGLSVVGANEKGMFISYSIEAEEYKQWLAQGNVPEPEFTEEELAQQELQVKLQEAQAYLNSTDWYYARKAETGEDVPAEVVEKRLASRKFIQDNIGAK